MKNIMWLPNNGEYLIGQIHHYGWINKCLRYPDVGFLFSNEKYILEYPKTNPSDILYEVKIYDKHLSVNSETKYGVCRRFKIISKYTPSPKKKSFFCNLINLIS